jgi:hypothetical protein
VEVAEEEGRQALQRMVARQHAAMLSCRLEEGAEAGSSDSSGTESSEGSECSGRSDGSEAIDRSAGSAGSPLPAAAAAAGCQLELSDGSSDEAEQPGSRPGGEVVPAGSQLAGGPAPTDSSEPDANDHSAADALRMSALEAMNKLIFAEPGLALLHSGPPLSRAAALCQLAPAVHELALVLGQLQRLPECMQVARLRNAKAVGSRPCANVACPSLAAADQEAAGTRHRVCRACRAVRYCSPECARVAWKAGGHRHVCAALAGAAAESAAQGVDAGS